MAKFRSPRLRISSWLRTLMSYRYISVTAYFGRELGPRSYTVLALQDVDEHIRQELANTQRDMQMAAILKSRYKMMNETLLLLVFFPGNVPAQDIHHHLVPLAAVNHMQLNPAYRFPPQAVLAYLLQVVLRCLRLFPQVLQRQQVAVGLHQSDADEAPKTVVYVAQDISDTKREHA